jgi:hypothetical protein
MRLVLVIEQIDGELPTANVELIKNGDGVIATATASAFDDPVFRSRKQRGRLGKVTRARLRGRNWARPAGYVITSLGWP